MKKYLFLFAIALTLFSCSKDKKIREHLNSKNVDDLVLGAWEAGESGDKSYVPLLLQNAADPSCSTNLRFKGFSIYQEKMFALNKILNENPPDTITRRPDSTNIKFYNNLWQKMNKAN